MLTNDILKTTLRTLSASFLYTFLAYIYPAYILLFVLTVFLFPIVFFLFKDSGIFFYCILYLFCFIRTLSSRSCSFAHGVFREEPCPFAVHEIQSRRLSFESTFCHNTVTFLSLFEAPFLHTHTHTGHNHTGNSNSWDCLCPLLFAFKSYWFHKIVFGFFLASPCLHYFDGPSNSSHTLLMNYLFFYSHSVWFVESRPFFFFFCPRILWWLSCKESAGNAGATGDAGSILGLGRSLGVNHGNALQYFCLKNPMDRGA